ncbi:hypothetical protein CHS0354_014167 [Potamilus streckersoni]|uniref:Uncharacterized protein n=1 Tax=Potamilus streckersoni TaxID=2493646 RepID=A0AAE0SMK2_9BIVA|nr:hypothetical protein CHS0354_014167 [Potamilus streckersoni]
MLDRILFRVYCASGSVLDQSSNNTVRYNTFEDCGGLVSFRFGDINIAEGNFFICHHVNGCGGVRMRGSHHKVINNYIDGAAHGGIILISDEIGNQNLIAFNTLYSCDTCIQIGTRSSKYTLSDNIFSNNVVEGHSSHSQLVWSGSENNSLFEGNVMHNGQITNHRYSSSIFSNLHLVKNDLGLYVPAPGSPAVKTASGSYSHVVHDDILGRARMKQPTDIGAVLSDESTAEHAHRKPLHRGDVGPTWAPDDSHLNGH